MIQGRANKKPFLLFLKLSDIIFFFIILILYAVLWCKGEYMLRPKFLPPCNYFKFFALSAKPAMAEAGVCWPEYT